jgi:hypothetical protein
VSGPPDARRVAIAAVLALAAVVALLVWASRRDDAASPDRRAATPEPRSPAAPADVAVIHVDASSPAAADANPGTEAEPIRTIGEAAARAMLRSGRGLRTEVVIAPGTYRESIELAAEGEATGGPIVLRGSPGSIVSGSDVWAGWSQVDGTGMFAHPWPYAWGPSGYPEAWASTAAGADLEAHPILRRREMIFADGRALRQELSREVVAATPGTFFVDEEHGVVYASAPPGVDLRSAEVEVAVRPTLLRATGVHDLTIRGLTFQHAASPIEGKAVEIADAEDVAIADSRFVWNNWLGLGVSRSSDVTIDSSVANHNGAGGMSGYQVDGLTVRDSETSYNNWRGSRGDPPDPSSAPDGNLIDFATGQKFFSLRDAVFLRFRSVGNLTGGLWLDWDNQRVVLDGLELRGNLTHGLFVEASRGPIVVTHGAFCDNEVGVLIGNAQRGTIEDSVVGDNAMAQIFVAGDPAGDRAVLNRDTHTWEQLRTSDWTIVDNRIMGADGRPALGTHLDESIWASFVDTLRSNGNTWMYEGSPAVFQVPGGQTIDLARWVPTTGQDAGSRAEEGAGRCVISAR